MITIGRRSNNHNFEKQNLVTQFDKRGQYDLFKCSLCGLTGKAYNFTEISVDGRDRKKAENCPGAKKAKQIKITVCRAVGRVFANLTPGSTHNVIPTPEGQDDARGVWVMGVGEPVKVLFGEYEEIE